MKSVLCILAALVVLSYGQQRQGVDPRNAAILQEARYLSTDGRFGAAYVQDDGIDFKEETDADGTRKGQYSYYDPNGMKTTVHYTAGKNGFQVEGDHLPKAPPAPPAPVPQPQYQQPKRQQQYRQEQAPVPQYNPRPQYNTIPTQNQPQNNGQYNYNNNYNNQQYDQQQQYYETTTTPAPRYFPPGKLNLNRTPDGYQYSFSSN